MGVTPGSTGRSMQSGVVIVAIPSNDDYVWKLSSEKVPHLTLLFLGDNVSNIADVTSYLEHVAKTTMCRFGLSVDRRGELGEKNADVLFFERFGIKMLEEVRAYLLAHPDISRAYDSTEQFPAWIPHLTMGYPETPAKPDNREYPGLHWVNFDRIAIWTEDYDGPEFLLDDNYSRGEVNMTDRVEEFLSHYGVKGMKWGIRKDRGHEGERARLTKIAKLDKKFERSNLNKLSFEIYDAAAKKTNEEDVPRINGKPQYKDADFTRDTPLRRRYYREHREALLDNLEAEARSRGTNASGTRRYGIVDLGDRWNLVIRDVQHAETDSNVLATVAVNKDDTGHILSFEFMPQAEHSELTEEFLSHYGILGMHWGIRRTREQIDKGLSGDARTTRRLLDKEKKGGVGSLTNKELKDLSGRLELEHRLRTAKKNRPHWFKSGHDSVKTALAVAGTASTAYTLYRSPFGQKVVSTGASFLRRYGVPAVSKAITVIR